MSELTICIGNKNYSSWSLRAWLALKHVGVPFDEVRVPLSQPDTKEKIRVLSPSGKVPALTHGGITVWDSLAVGEYLAETFPAACLWPEAKGARAVARSVSAEMHSGFAELRSHMPMNIRARRPGVGRTRGALLDVHRVLTLWSDCRARFGAGGPFLFGTFTVADAMYAPVVTRFQTYDVRLHDVAAAYSAAILELPAMKEWCAAAESEAERIAHDEYDSAIY